MIKYFKNENIEELLPRMHYGCLKRHLAIGDTHNKLHKMNLHILLKNYQFKLL